MIVLQAKLAEDNGDNPVKLGIQGIGQAMIQLGRQVLLGSLAWDKG